jgi:hypothetical protein
VRPCQRCGCELELRTVISAFDDRPTTYVFQVPGMQAARAVLESLYPCPLLQISLVSHGLRRVWLLRDRCLRGVIRR